MSDFLCSSRLRIDGVQIDQGGILGRLKVPILSIEMFAALKWFILFIYLFR